MAGPGRPRLPEDQKQRPTKMVRMYADQAEKLAWIMRLDPQEGEESIADFLESTCGTETDNRFAPISKRVEIIKAAERGDDVVPVMQNSLASEG